MLHRKAKRLAARWWVPAALAFAVGGGVLAQSALAAAPTPESNTSCGGTVTRAKPTSLDPYLLNYQFSCDWGISAYTILVNRKPSDYTTIDDYNGAPSVFDPVGTPDAKVSVVCSGTIPGISINCNAGAGGVIPAPGVTEGSLDTTAPLCPYIPKGSPKGTKPQPGAIVELVVSDTTGAEDGPFRLYLTGKCPSPAKAGAKTPFVPKSSSKKK
ncbi:MAG TPA: hypothetical protein VMF57_15505 [Solirubrobacteraceae bacterium]|nr:hypothetical protein [Solirubrobacteraceae bacterium]